MHIVTLKSGKKIWLDTIGKNERGDITGTKANKDDPRRVGRFTIPVESVDFVTEYDPKD